MGRVIGCEVTCELGGYGHIVETQSVVLVRCGRVKDLRGVRYDAIGGCLDDYGVSERGQGRFNDGARRAK